MADTCDLSELLAEGGLLAKQGDEVVLVGPAQSIRRSSYLPRCSQTNGGKTENEVGRVPSWSAVVT